MLLKLSAWAARTGRYGLSSFLVELDCFLSGLSGASRRIRKERDRRMQRPFVETLVEGPGL